MENSNLLALAAALSLFGLLLLAYAAYSTSPQELQLAQITNSHEGKVISTEGEITALRQLNGNYFFTICDGACISAVVFKRDVPALSSHETNILLLRKGDYVAVKGKISNYKGQLEILPSPPDGILFLRR